MIHQISRIRLVKVVRFLIRTKEEKEQYDGSSTFGVRVTLCDNRGFSTRVFKPQYVVLFENVSYAYAIVNLENGDIAVVKGRGV
jgi:hypothetical protein